MADYDSYFGFRFMYAKTTCQTRIRNGLWCDGLRFIMEHGQCRSMVHGGLRYDGLLFMCSIIAEIVLSPIPEDGQRCHSYRSQHPNERVVLLIDVFRSNLRCCFYCY